MTLNYRLPVTITHPNRGIWHWNHHYRIIRACLNKVFIWMASISVMSGSCRLDTYRVIGIISPDYHPVVIIPCVACSGCRPCFKHLLHFLEYVSRIGLIVSLFWRWCRERSLCFSSQCCLSANTFVIFLYCLYQLTVTNKKTFSASVTKNVKDPVMVSTKLLG